MEKIKWISIRIDWMGPMVGDQIDLKITTHLEWSSYKYVYSRLPLIHTKCYNIKISLHHHKKQKT